MGLLIVINLTLTKLTSVVRISFNVKSYSTNLGESPPPLPTSEPPNNYAGHRQYSLENSGSIYG
jgi:hypothetical protein